MKDHKDKEDQEEKEHFKSKRRHPTMGRTMQKRMVPAHSIGHRTHAPGRILRHSMGHLKDFDNKEDIISYLELKKKRVQKQKKYMMIEMEHMDKIYDLLSEGIISVDKMEEYSPENLKSYFKKEYLKIQHEILDEED